MHKGLIDHHYKQTNDTKNLPSRYLCFISFLYLDLYVLGSDALIS